VILILIALSAPLGRLASAIPSAVVGGTAMVVFAIIGTMGIDMLRKVDLHERGNMFVLAGALTMGLLPIVVPGLYSRFPDTLQLVLGNGLAMGSLTAVLLNMLFNRVACRQPGRRRIHQARGGAGIAVARRIALLFPLSCSLFLFSPCLLNSMPRSSRPTSCCSFPTT
jgi:xanthine/uracil permease